MDFGFSFHVLSISEVALDSFAVELYYYSIVLSSMMLFKRSFGPTRSLFILYIHEHDRLGYGVLTVKTAVVHLPNCDRKGQSSVVSGRILFSGIVGRVL